MVTCSATMTYVYVQLCWLKIPTAFKFYGVTCSNSSHPFLCALVLINMSGSTQHNWHSAISEINQTFLSKPHWGILKDAHWKAISKVHVPTWSLGVEKSEEGTLMNVYGTDVYKSPTLLVYCKFLASCPCNCWSINRKFTIYKTRG